jgi:hypothetical protein
MPTEPLPPGHYTVVIERTRKVRNKPLQRIHMRVVDTGQKVTETIKREPPLSSEVLLDRADAIIRELDELQEDSDLEEPGDLEGIDEREPKDYVW